MTEGWIRDLGLARVLGATGAVLVPCFWQTRIQAGDLSSHLYNAWLARLIAAGKAPGLWLAHPPTNVLFDWLLTGIARVAGFWWAEHVGAAICVLAFFWGAFAFVRAATRRAAWTVAPLLAILTYGWVFRAGFFNFYLSLGLSLILLSMMWSAFPRDLPRVAILLIVGIFAWLAQPLPLVWAIAAAIYVQIARRLMWRGRIALFCAAIVSVIGASEAFMHGLTAHWYKRQILLATGMDQAAVYSPREWWFAGGLVVLCIILLLGARENPLGLVGSAAAQLLFISALSVVLLPDGVLLSTDRHEWFYYIAERMSLLTAVFACAVIGNIPPRAWHAIAFGAIALVFFANSYLRERELNIVESETAGLVSALTPGQRVFFDFPWRADGEPDLESLWQGFPQPRVPWAAEHIVDRACIGRCFSYANYEPVSGEFRVRVLPSRNGIVVADAAEADEMKFGAYRIRAEDLPVYQLYRCVPQSLAVCIRPRQVGELNGGTP